MSRARLRSCLVPITPNASLITQSWEGAGSRVNHEPEDLPGSLTEIPSWAGELARMSCGCNPQGLTTALGIFYFQHVENGFTLCSRFAQRLRRTGASTSRRFACCGLAEKLC